MTFGSTLTFRTMQLSLVFILAVMMIHATAAGNRFLLDNPNLDPASGSAAGSSRRSLLNYNNACGSTGSAPDFECKSKFPAYKNSTCCTNTVDSSKQCYDVGANLDSMCGSCNNKCAFGYTCCSGVCVNLQTDADNCGYCGNKCKNNNNNNNVQQSCKSGMCGYGAAGKST